MLDDELAALWHREVSDERNPTFTLTLLRRIERNLFWRAIAFNIVAVCAATLLLAFIAPILAIFVRQNFMSFVSGPVAAALLTAFGVLLSRMPVSSIRRDASFKTKRSLN